MSRIRFAALADLTRGHANITSKAITTFGTAEKTSAHEKPLWLNAKFAKTNMTRRSN